MNCEQARDLIPMYTARALSAWESAELVGHAVRCETCQEELVQAVWLGHELRQAFSRLPGAPRGTWLAVAAWTHGLPLLRVDLGSELVGLAIGATATRTGIPLSGRLSLLGQEVPVFRI